MAAIDRLYFGTEQVLKAFNTLGPSTNSEVAEYLNRQPDGILKGVVRYRNEGLLRKVPGPNQRTTRHVLTLKGVEKLARKRRNRRPAELAKAVTAKARVHAVPNSIFSMAACMGLAKQPTYAIATNG